MRSDLKNFSGQRFGRLTAIEPKRIKNRTHWLCKCDCGTVLFVMRQCLVSGQQSCGCLKNEKSSERNKQKAIDSEEQRFYDSIEMIPESGCWIWTGSVDEKGYGRTTSKGKPITTHRWSWVLHNGNVDNGLHVLHKCDVRSCCNPSHLFLGTHKDNMQDRVTRVRAPTPLALISLAAPAPG